MADEPKIELINDKWQNILPQYESNRFDLAIVDPPYGINVNHNMGRRKGDKQSDYKPVKWDSESPDTIYFEELKRVSKNQIIWGANHFIESMAENSSCWIIWDKLFSDAVSFAQFEMAWTSFEGTCKKFAKHPGQPDRIHPTQKPVALYRWILSKYAKPGDTILDTHLGSGSSAIAAWQKKHDFVGIECDTEYYDDMLHRFNMNTNREYALEKWQKQSEQAGQQTIFSE